MHIESQKCWQKGMSSLTFVMERDYQYLRTIASLDSNTGIQELLGGSSRNTNEVQLSEGVNNMLRPAWA